MQATTMTGPMMLNGMRSMAAKNGTVASTSTTAITLPMYMVAIRPQTKAGRPMNSIGPGDRPQINRAANITAAVAEAGMARASMGSSAHEPAEWSAVSGETMPSGSPLPKLAL